MIQPNAPTSLVRALRGIASAIFTRTTDRPILASKSVRLMLGGGVFVFAAGAAAYAMQGGSGSAADGMNSADRAKIEAVVREYILANPEIIPQAIEKLQANRMSKTINENRTALETPYAGAWEGAEKGDVILVEFFDYACGYCRTSLPVLSRLVDEDKGLKIVYRELPILSDESADAAKVSLLAAERGSASYMAYHKALYDLGQVSRSTIMEAAVKAGLDRKKAEAALSSPNYAREIDSNIRLAQALQASGTPTFVVGGQVLNGAVGYDTLKAAIAKARGR